MVYIFGHEREYTQFSKLWRISMEFQMYINGCANVQRFQKLQNFYIKYNIEYT